MERQVEFSSNPDVQKRILHFIGQGDNRDQAIRKVAQEVNAGRISLVTSQTGKAVQKLNATQILVKQRELLSLFENGRSESPETSRLFKELEGVKSGEQATGTLWLRKVTITGMKPLFFMVLDIGLHPSDGEQVTKARYTMMEQWGQDKVWPHVDKDKVIWPLKLVIESWKYPNPKEFAEAVSTAEKRGDSVRKAFAVPQRRYLDEHRRTQKKVAAPPEALVSKEEAAAELPTRRRKPLGVQRASPPPPQPSALDERVAVSPVRERRSSRVPEAAPKDSPLQDDLGEESGGAGIIVPALIGLCFASLVAAAILNRAKIQKAVQTWRA